MTRVYVKDITWSVENRRIVDGALLDVQPGEFVGLIGPNGCGKSSLLRTIYRALRPDAGLITLDGDAVWEMDARTTARHTAVVTQERGGEFDFNVYEIVMMGRTPHKGYFDRNTAEDFAIVDDALQRVGMGDFARRSFQTLSGGEKQRVLLARALAQQVDFLVLDEPTNHLDIRYQLEMLGLVRSAGVTALAALHDLNLAAHYCDRIFLMQGGRIVASGTPEQVLTPAYIRDVYGVDALVERHAVSGSMQIVYLPLPHSGNRAGVESLLQSREQAVTAQNARLLLNPITEE